MADYEIHGAFCIPLGIAKLRGLIYVLCQFGPISIYAYEDRFPRDLLMITLTETISSPKDMVGIDNSNTLYVWSVNKNCVWKIDMNNQYVVRWLSIKGVLHSLSVTSDSRLLVLSSFGFLNTLDVYEQDGTRITSIMFLWRNGDSYKAFQKPDGEFIVTYFCLNERRRFIMFLNANGRLISQFSYSEKESINGSFDTCFDRYNNRLLFGNEKAMFLFDMNTFSWSQVGQRNITGMWNLYCDGELNQVIGTRTSKMKIITIEGH